MLRDSDPSFARQQANSAHGKLDDELPATRIESEVKLGLMKIAAEAGVSLSAVIANLARVRVLGFDHVAKVNEERLRMVVGMPEESREVPGAGGLRVVEGNRG